MVYRAWLTRPVKHRLVGPVQKIGGKQVGGEKYIGLCGRCGKRNVSESSQCFGERMIK